MNDVHGGVDLAQQFFGQDGGADFAMGVAGGEELEHPCQTIVAEAFIRGEEHAPPTVERIAFASPMPEGHLLDSASGVIDCNVGVLAWKWPTTRTALGRCVSSARR